ncbi:hypothetical protein ES703_84694 [subsurface metagenome]
MCSTTVEAAAVIDDIVGVMLNRVVFVFIAAEHLCRPGMVRPVVDVVHSPVQPVNVDVGIMSIR